jgi:hypothetical protein
VRYDVSQVGAGGCVFAEYEGYVDLDYQPGALPGTPPEQVVQVLSLAPRHGGTTQTFVFAGSGKFEGAPVEAPGGNGTTDVVEGGRPSPAFAAWKPELTPDQEYCATITIYGRNDLAVEALRSEQICAPVMNVDARSPTPAPSDAAVGTPAAVDASPAGPPPADAGAGTEQPAAPGPAVASDGCSLGRGRASSASAVALALIALGYAARRSRRSAGSAPAPAPARPSRRA